LGIAFFYKECSDVITAFYEPAGEMNIGIFELESSSAAERVKSKKLAARRLSIANRRWGA